MLEARDPALVDQKAKAKLKRQLALSELGEDLKVLFEALDALAASDHLVEEMQCALKPRS